MPAGVNSPQLAICTTINQPISSVVGESSFKVTIMQKYIKVHSKEFNTITWINTEHITSIGHEVDNDMYTISYGNCEMRIPKKEGEKLIEMLGL